MNVENFLVISLRSSIGVVVKKSGRRGKETADRRE